MSSCVKVKLLYSSRCHKPLLLEFGISVGVLSLRDSWKHFGSAQCQYFGNALGQSGPVLATFRSIWTSVGDFPVNLTPMFVTFRSIWTSVGDFSVNLDQCW